MNSLPVGPVQTGGMYYACNRMGYNALVAHVWWGAGVFDDLPEAAQRHNSRDVVLLTRVMEKPALLSVACLGELLDICFKEPLQSGALQGIEIWQDCGPHYRAQRMVDAAAWWLPEHYKISCNLSFGLESHMKGYCDGLTAQLGKWKTAAAREELIKEICKLTEVFNTTAQKLEAANPTRVPFTCVEFMPPERSSFDKMILKLNPRSLPVNLTASHSWQFRRNDARRRTVVGNDGVTLTGVDAKAAFIPGTAAAPDMKTFLRLKPAAEEPDEAEEPAGPEEAGPAMDLEEQLLTENTRVQTQK